MNPQEQTALEPRAIVRRKPAYNIVAGALAVLIVALSYAPLLWLGFMSVSPDPLTGMPGTPTWQWYAMLFEDGKWLAPLGTSLLFAIIVALLCATVTPIVARQIPHMRHGGALMALFLVPLVIPGVLLGVGLFFYYRVTLGLPMGPWALITSHFVWAFPFALLALLINTTQFDIRLRDAASDLGASPWRAFIDVELPHLMPGVAGAALFGFLLSFNELSRSVLLRGGTTTLPIYQWTQASAHTSNVPLLFPLSTIMLVFSLVMITAAYWLLLGQRRKPA
jgi:ABC-type spermidine/putrescine transport system permease subunit II